MNEFRYKFVDHEGNETGFRYKKGYVDRKEVALDYMTIPHTSIQETVVIGDRLIMAINYDSSLHKDLFDKMYDRKLALTIKNAKPVDVKREIDIVVSRLHIKRRKQELQHQGEPNLFRATKCPRCNCAIDLSNFERTPYTYCPYCEVIFATKSKRLVDDSLTHSICPECKTYGEVRGHLDFFFYFVIIAYGYRYETKYMCPTCASKMANRLFFINLLFVLGLFPTLYTKIRSLWMMGGSELNRVRNLSLSGQYAKAAPIYKQLYETQRAHPAILMNQAIGHLYGNDTEQGIKLLERSLKACANYLPTRAIAQTLGTMHSQNAEATTISY